MGATQQRSASVQARAGGPAISASTIVATGNITSGGRFFAANDSAGAPGYSYTSDTDSGMARSSANAIVIATAGSARLYADATAIATLNVNTWQVNNGEQYNAPITPTTLAANTNNWNPTGLTTCNRIRASADAARDLTGIDASSAGVNGRRYRLQNIGAFAITLKHDVTSTAANRFYCPNNADVVLRPNGFVDIEYDTAVSRWRVSGA